MAFTVGIRLARPLPAGRVHVTQRRLEPPPGFAQGVEAALELVSLAGRLVGGPMDVLSCRHRAWRGSTSVPHARPGSTADHRGLRRGRTTHHKTLGCENRFSSDAGDSDAGGEILTLTGQKGGDGSRPRGS